MKSSSPAPPREAPPQEGARRLAAILDRFAPGLTFVVLIVAWEAASRLFEIPSFLLPAPSAILEAGLAVPVTVWLGHIWATLRSR